MRFHKLSKFGDNLTNIRASVKYVNSHLKPTVGFEEGKIFNGYRFVYPLFDTQHKHIGSVEVSSSLLTFKSIFEKANDEHIDYVLRKDIIESKVFKDQMQNYVTYPLSSKFLIQRTLFEENKTDLHISIRNKIIQKIKTNKPLLNRIENMEEFYYILYLNEHIYTVHFISLYNDFTHEKVGYSIIYSDSKYFQYFYNYYLVTLIVLILLSFLVGYIFYKKDKHKHYMEKKAKEYKEILNIYENIIVVVRNCKIINANNRLFDFFDIRSLDELNSRSDIRTLFIQRFPICNPSAEFKEETYDNQINLKNSKNKEHIFTLFIHKLDDSNKTDVIIELIDITQHQKEKTILQKQALYDKLTQIYNRHYFESIIQTKFDKAKKSSTPLSLIMFDIDHFKDINDTYGHNIGDDSLLFLTTLFTENIREDDIFCRWGGEEFMILLSIPLEQSVKIAEQLREKIDTSTMQNEKIPHFTCSFGVLFLNNQKDIKEALNNVDALLYGAKSNGRNQVNF